MNHREIKFRAWDKKRKRMYNVLHLHLPTVLNGGIWATVEGYNVIAQKEVHLQIQPEDIVIKEYTGLKDKNGKEIYEADKLTYYTDTSMCDLEVQFIDGCFMGVGPFTTHPLISLMNATDFQAIEIIGNIYEN